MIPPTLNESAIAAHELYLSFVSAGFTEDQALEMVTDIIIAGAENPGGN